MLPELEFHSSDILMANKELYQMLGSMSDRNVALDAASEQVAYAMLAIANPDLYTKKCLLPLHSTDPAQVAAKVRNGLLSKSATSKLKSLFQILQENANLTDYFQFVPAAYRRQSRSQLDS